MTDYQDEIKSINKKEPINQKKDPRKVPKPGYNETNPKNKKDIQQHPEDQNTG